MANVLEMFNGLTAEANKLDYTPITPGDYTATLGACVGEWKFHESNGYNKQGGWADKTPQVQFTYMVNIPGKDKPRKMVVSENPFSYKRFSDLTPAEQESDDFAPSTIKLGSTGEYYALQLTQDEEGKSVWTRVRNVERTQKALNRIAAIMADAGIIEHGSSLSSEDIQNIPVTLAESEGKEIGLTIAISEGGFNEVAGTRSAEDAQAMDTVEQEDSAVPMETIS